jgi:hypothetical protein
VVKDAYGNVVISWKYGLLPGDNHLVTIITYRGNCSWMKSNLQKLPTTGYLGLGEFFDPTKPIFFVLIGIIAVGCASAAFGYRWHTKKGSKNVKVVEKRVKGRMQRPGMPKAGLKIDVNNGMKQPKVNESKIVRPGMPKKDI